MPKLQNQRKKPQATEATKPQSHFRVNDASEALRLYHDAFDAHRKWNRRVKNILALIGGALPDDPVELRRQGMADYPNVNWGEAEQIADQRERMFFNRIVQEETIATFTSTAPNQNKDKRLIYGKMIAQRFTELLKRTPSFWITLRQHLKHYVRTGHGHRQFKNDYTYVADPLDFRNLILTEDSLADVHDFGPVFFVVMDRSFHELYDMVRDDEAKDRASDRGWVPSEVIKLLIRRSNKSKSKTWTESELSENKQAAFMHEYEGRALTTQFTDTEKVRLIQQYTREFDGTWSLQVFEEVASEPANNRTSKKATKFSYLRRELDHTDDIAKVIFPAYMGLDTEMKHYAAFGAVTKSYNEIITKNDIRNSMVGGLKWSESIVVRNTGSEKPQISKFKGIGDIILLPDNVEIDDTAAKSRSNSRALEVFGVLNQNMEKKNQLSAPSLAAPLGSVQPASAEAVEQSANGAVDFNQAEMLNYDLWHGPFLAETYKRAINPDYDEDDEGYTEAKWFRDSLLEDGVPKEVLEMQHLFISPTPSIGFGSSGHRKQAIQQILQNRDDLGLDAVGIESATRQFLISTLGSVDALNEFMPAEGKERVTEAQQQAAIENHILRLGGSIPVTAGERDLEHFDTHLIVIVEVQQALQEQAMDPAQGLTRVQVANAHNQAHLEQMRGGRTSIGRELKKRNNIHEGNVAYQQQLQGLVAQIQQDQSEQEQVRLQEEQQNKLTDAKVKELEIQVNGLLDDKKADQLHDRRIRQDEREQTRKDQNALRDQDRKDRETSATTSN